MEVKILEFVEGARKAEGVVVIIDVFRAFSVACYAFDCGALKLIAVQTPSDAFSLKKIYKNSLLIGERDEKKIEGFDLGNSPTEIIKTDIEGKIIIQTTTSGTKGLANAINADTIITGSLVNLSAIVHYIKTLNPKYVSLVAMGYRATQSAEEDILCAELISAGLKNKIDISDKKIADLQYSSGKRFFDSKNIDFSPPSDFFLCTMVDRFNFVLKAVPRTDGYLELIRIDI
jgi:2-phosphosulfolactate phosphatase